jgi:chromatin remodeling complex protein RSC6
MFKKKMSEPVEPTTTEDVEGVFEDRINDIVYRLENNAKEAKNIASELKVLKKEHNKIVKKITGSRRKKVAKDPNAPKKAPSGFAKPTKISAALATFLGVSDGEMIARPDVTKGITKYVKEHNLQKEENKRIIDLSKPGGEALIELLNVPEGAELTFFNLQKYLKIHFPVSIKESKPKEPKAPKVPKEKAAPKPRASKKVVKEEEDEEVPVKETKKRATKAKEVVEEAPAKPARKTKTKEVVEEPVKATKASKAKQAKAVEVDEDEEVPEEAPVEDKQPRRRRRAEEAA